jgi:aryl-alcohol dehydrogenase-like predicted oxidoreductase
MRSTGAGPANGTREAVRAAIEGSLRRLGTDYIDHYQLHNPDPETPIGETLAALAELVTEGKVREIGCSNFSAAQLDESTTAASAGFSTVQNHYSLLTRTPETDGVLDACARHSIGLVPYFPLESGVLTGKYRAGEGLPDGSRLAAWGDRAGAFIDDDRLATVAAISEWAAAHDHTVLDAAMSWLVGNPQVTTVISGATKPEQVRSNVKSSGWAMDPDERAALERLLA